MTASAHEHPPAGHHLPVTVVVSRRPAAGREAELVEWAHGIVTAASAFPGHLGAQVHEPSPPDRDDLVIAFSFSDAMTLSDWEHSAVRAQWLERAAPLVEGGSTAHTVTGLEALFAGPKARTPPKWKTATVIWVALFPFSVLVNWLLGPALRDLPLPVRVLVTSLLIVPWMVWAGVPWLSKLLRGWLAPR